MDGNGQCGWQPAMDTAMDHNANIIEMGIGDDFYVAMIDVTPELARDWLARSGGNFRERTGAWVSKLARDMRDGKFVTTHQGIAFSSNGSLVDGQHRLAAIIRSGATIRLLVCFGFDSVAEVDVGRKRSHFDYCRATGIEVNKSAVQVARGLLEIQGKKASDPKVVSEFCASILPTINRVGLMRRPFMGNKGLRSTGVWAAIVAAITSGVPDDVIEEFVSVWEDLQHTGNPASIIVSKFARTCLEGKIDGGRVGRKWAFNVTTHLIKALAEGSSIEKLPKRFGTDPAYEVVVAKRKAS